MNTVVTAAVIFHEGKILVARRATGAHAGRWEFPGGKIEPGETPEQCLTRELNEEFRGEFRVGEFLAAVRFKVGEKECELQAFRAELQSDTVVPLEHSEIRWVAPQDVLSFDLLEADQEIVRILKECGEL